MVKAIKRLISKYLNKGNKNTIDTLDINNTNISNTGNTIISLNKYPNIPSKPKYQIVHKNYGIFQGIDINNNLYFSKVFLNPYMGIRSFTFEQDAKEIASILSDNNPAINKHDLTIEPYDIQAELDLRYGILLASGKEGFC